MNSVHLASPMYLRNIFIALLCLSAATLLFVFAIPTQIAYAQTDINVEGVRTDGTLVGSAAAETKTEEDQCPDVWWGFICKTLAVTRNLGIIVLDAFMGGIAFGFGLLFKGVAEMTNGMIGWLMNLTVNPGNSNTTTIVQVGWAMSRDLVNLLFLIVLVFIGFATILRLPNYEMKKTLPLLLIVALLVNFSGVFVGLVVDVGSIITQFFLQGSMDIGWDSALRFAGVTDPTEQTAGAIFATRLVQIVYYVVATFIFFTLLVIFFMRTFVLWTLAILAPFAFAAYILPSTRSISTKWFSALLQWAFVGVPIAFFMLFASLAIRATQEGSLTQGAPFLAEFLGPFAALFFLFVGIVTAITMAPAGANKAIDWAKGSGKRFVGIARTRTTDVTGRMQRQMSSSFRAARAMGQPRWRAATMAVGKYFQRRARRFDPRRPAGRGNIGRALIATTTGTLRAVGDIAMAGTRQAFKLKDPKKKGLRPGGCPSCGLRRVAASAITCPRCGYTF